MTGLTGQFKRQLPRNALGQVLAFGVQVGVGIWLVPYLIRNLGMAAYGLIPLAGLLTGYVSLVSYSIAGAVSRFLTLALQREEHEEANRIFSTAFFTYVGIGVLQGPVFLLVLAYADRLIAIPPALYRDALLLLACSAAAFTVDLVGSVFGVPLYARNRLDLARGVDIGRQVLRAAGIAVLFLAASPALRYVGYVDLCLSLLGCATQAWLARRLAPTLRLGVRHYDRRKIRPLLGMGGWLLINNIGSFLFLRMDVWVCSRFLGAEAAGEYAAIQQWTLLIRHGGMIISTLVAPMLLIYYARGDQARVVRLSCAAVRLLSLGSAVPIALLSVGSAPLLRLWLGAEYERLAPLMALTLLPLSVNVGALPLFHIPLALNRVRLPALMTLGMGLANVALALVWVRGLGGGLLAVAAVGAVVLTAKNALFTPLYAAHILQVPWPTFMRPMRAALALLAGLLAVGAAALAAGAGGGWLSMVVLGTGLGMAGAAVAWRLLPAGDRRLLVELAPGGVGRHLARWMDDA